MRVHGFCLFRLETGDAEEQGHADQAETAPAAPRRLPPRSEGGAAEQHPRKGGGTDTGNERSIQPHGTGMSPGLDFLIGFRSLPQVGEFVKMSFFRRRKRPLHAAIAWHRLRQALRQVCAALPGAPTGASFASLPTVNAQIKAERLHSIANDSTV